MKTVLTLTALLVVFGCTASPDVVTDESPRAASVHPRSRAAHWKPPHQEVADAFYQSLNRIIGYKQAESVGDPSRIKHIRPKAPKKPGRTAAIETPSAEASAETLYKKAHHLYTVGDYPECRGRFHAFLERFPSHGLSDNAWYWIGECYYAEGDYQAAVGAFQAVLSRFDAGNKRPDALLKIGLSHLKSGGKVEAGDFLSQVVNSYPESGASVIATKLLRQL